MQKTGRQAKSSTSWQTKAGLENVNPAIGDHSIPGRSEEGTNKDRIGRWPLTGGLVFGLMAFVALLCGVPSATARDVQDIPPLPDRARAPDRSIERATLVAGDLRLEISRRLPDQPLSFGQKVFLDLIARNSGNGSAQAEITLATAGAKLIRVHGASARENNDRHDVSLSRVTRSRPVELLVELELEGGASATVGRSTSQVDVLLRDGRSEENSETAAVPASRSFTWRVTRDCSADFHQALLRLNADYGPLLTDAVKMVRNRDADLPGRWHFPATRQKRDVTYRTETVEEEYCARRRSVVENGTRVRKCVDLRTRTKTNRIPVEPDGGGPVDLTREAQAMVRTASGYVGSRGLERDLLTRGVHGWVSYQMIRDLKTYLNQAAHPALCSGTPELLGYLVDNSGRFRASVNAAIERAEQARALAGTYVASAERLAGAGTTPEPAAIGARDANAELAAQVARLAALLAADTQAAPGSEAGGDAAPPIGSSTDGARDADTGSATDVPLSATTAPEIDNGRKVRALLARFSALPASPRRPDDTALSGDAALATRNALTMVETAIYLHNAARRYGQMADAIYGAIDAARRAHAETCICAAN